MNFRTLTFRAQLFESCLRYFYMTRSVDFRTVKEYKFAQNSTNKKNVFNILDTKMFSSSFKCQKVQPFLGLRKNITFCD